MEFDQDDIVVSDGFDSDGKGDESDEEKLNTLTDREKQEVYFQRRKHKKEAQERLELAANHNPVGLDDSDDHVGEIDELHKEITTHLLSLVVCPETLAGLFSSPFLPKLVSKSLFYLPEQDKIVIGNDVVFKTNEPYIFNHNTTAMYLETSKIPKREYFKFTEIGGILNLGSVAKAISYFVENILITNNIQPFLDINNLNKIIQDKKNLNNGKYEIDKQVLLFKIKKKAYSVVYPNKLTIPQLKGIIKDLVLVSDEEIIKEDSELGVVIKTKIEFLKTEMKKMEKELEEKKKEEKSILFEKLKKKYSKKSMFDEIGIRSNETKIKTIKEWLEAKSVNTSLSEKNMVRGIIQQLKEFKI